MTNSAECSKGGQARFADIASHGTVPIRPFALRLVAETYGSQSGRSCPRQQICIGNDRVAGQAPPITEERAPHDSALEAALPCDAGGDRVWYNAARGVG